MKRILIILALLSIAASTNKVEVAIKEKKVKQKDEPKFYASPGREKHDKPPPPGKTK